MSGRLLPGCGGWLAGTAARRRTLGRRPQRPAPPLDRDAPLRWHFHGQLSGVEEEQHTSVIYTFRDGRVILEQFFLDHEQALNAVGLSE
jgi:hypothetical protein